MSLFSFYVLPYSAKSEGVLLPRGNWNLYKVYWQTDSKSPNLFEEHSKPQSDSWLSSTLLYNKSLHSIEDPFGWNNALSIPQQTQNLLRRALDVSSKTSDIL
jgi:hypothetical protein